MLYIFWMSKTSVNIESWWEKLKVNFNLSHNNLVEVRLHFFIFLLIKRQTKSLQKLKIQFGPNSSNWYISVFKKIVINLIFFQRLKWPPEPWDARLHHKREIKGNPKLGERGSNQEILVADRMPELHSSYRQDRQAEDVDMRHPGIQT